jgi:hypothetical protein
MDIQKWLHIDRRIIYLVVAIGALIPVIRPIGLPVISFDFGPSSEPELNPMADAILRHCFIKELKVVIVAIFPLGGVSMAIQEVARIEQEFDLEYAVDYVNLGYKDGGQAPMKAMGVSIRDVFPDDVEGNPTDDMPIVNEVRNYDDVEVVISLATGIIGEWWANLINAQFGVDVAVGCTAVSAPKYYAYLRSGQMIGVLGGLKGASEYEKLLTDRYPEARATYEIPVEKKRSAMVGMDVQSIVHLIIIAFIIFGNAMYFAARKSRGGK